MPTSNTTAILSASSQILWEPSAPFYGYVWLGLALPSTYPTPALPFTGPRKQPIPIYTKINISAGILDQSVEVYRNDAIEPPGTTYRAYYFDQNGIRIAPPVGSAGAFSIANSYYVLSIPTLSTPSYAGISAPRPLS